MVHRSLVVNRIRYLLIVSLALLIGNTLDLNAQDNKLVFSKLTTDDGLSSNMVMSTFQDSRGFIWVCTSDGLNRFDGYSFKTYRPEKNNPNSMQSVLCTKIVEDNYGFLWVTTSNKGVARFNPETETFKHYTKENTGDTGIWHNNIQKVMIDNDGVIWLGTNKGLNTLQPDYEKDTVYVKRIVLDPKKKKQKNIDAIFQGSNNIVYVTAVQSYQIKKKKNDYKVSYIKHIKRRINGLAFAETNDHKIIFWSGNLIYYLDTKKKNGTLIPLKKPKKLENVNLEFKQLSFTKGNTLILGLKDGIARVECDFLKKRIKFLSMHVPDNSDPDALSGSFVRNILRDKTGVIWLSIYGKGINRFDLEHKKFYNIKPQNNNRAFGNSRVKALLEDKHSNLWLTIPQVGLLFLPKDSSYKSNYKKLLLNNDQSQRHLYSLTERPSANTVIATSWKIFEVYNPTDSPELKDEELTKKIIFTEDKKLPGGYIFCAHHQNNKNNLWAPSHKWGLTKITYNETDTLSVTYSHDPKNKNSLVGNHVRYIYQDKMNDYWIGTSSGLSKMTLGANESDTPSFTNYIHDKNDTSSLPFNYIIHITETNNGVMWLGTMGGGLIKVLRDANNTVTGFKNYTQEHGLVNDVVKFTLEDKLENIWIGTSSGLCQFDPKTELFKTYDKKDGLIATDFSDNSGIKRRNGEFVMGTGSGLIVFRPEEIKDNSYTPDVCFTDLKLLNESVGVHEERYGKVVLEKNFSLTNEIELSYKDNIISIEFAALHYANSQKNKYKYKLEGFDTKWVHTDASRRVATYTNLDGGTYTLKLMASNNDGLWNEKAKELKITIVPPYWETLWFKILLGLILIGIALSIYFWRVAQLKKDQRILEDKVQQRTSELRKTNSALEEKQEEILQQNEEIQQQNEEIRVQKEHVETIYNNTKTLSEVGKNLTSTLDLEKVFDMLYSYVKSMMNVSEFGIGSHHPEEHNLQFLTYKRKGVNTSTFSISLDREDSISAWCINNKQAVFMENTQTDSLNYVKNVPPEFIANNINSTIMLPLLIENKPVGILLVNSQKKYALKSTDLANLQVLANYIAIAMDNAGAYKMVSKQKEALDQQNENIKSSIRYAKSIQNAILPDFNTIDTSFEQFVLFRPKDIVSGDFYWYSAIVTEEPKQLKQNQAIDYTYYAAVDCTGHGVPGAFMSMIGSRILSEIVQNKKIYSPSKVLLELHRVIHKSLQQDVTQNHDGMDVSLCRIEKQKVDGQLKYNIVYSGARRPIVYFDSKQNKIVKLKGSVSRIGGKASRLEKNFDNVELQLVPNDIIYLTSDGFADQNNADRKSFNSANLYNLFSEIALLPLQDQKLRLETELENYMQEEKQRDDITILGIKL